MELLYSLVHEVPPGLPLAAEQQVAMHAESLYIDSIFVFVILVSHFLNDSFQNDLCTVSILMRSQGCVPRGASE